MNMQQAKVYFSWADIVEILDSDSSKVIISKEKCSFSRKALNNVNFISIAKFSKELYTLHLKRHTSNIGEIRPFVISLVCKVAEVRFRGKVYLFLIGAGNLVVDSCDLHSYNIVTDSRVLAKFKIVYPNYAMLD